MCFSSTAKNTIILSTFLVWKFCGKTKFPHNLGKRFWGSCTFPQNFHAKKLGEITVFFAEIDEQKAF